MTCGGYTRKDHAKTVLKKHFIDEVDYKVRKAAPATSGAAFTDEENRGGSGKRISQFL